MKPSKGQSRADWMKAAVPHFVGEGQSEEEAIRTATELFQKEGDGPREGIELKAAIKQRDFTADEVKALCKARGIVYVEGCEKNVAVFEISNQRVDRDGDILIMDGIDLKNFRNNPVVLWGHDSYAPPIGNSLKEELDKSNAADPKWVATVLFHEVTEIAMAVCELVKLHFIRAVSVGFRPKMPGGVEFPDEKMRGELGMRPGGVIFRSVELYEFSVCSIPANANALSRETAKGISKAARQFGIEKGILTPSEDLSDLDSEPSEEEKAEEAQRLRTLDMKARLDSLKRKHPKAFQSPLDARAQLALDRLAKI